jgi:hypothetical protein
VNVFLALFLLTALATVAQAEGSRDTQNTTEFAETILTQLKTGEFDALESEYQDFRRPRTPATVFSRLLKVSSPAR